MSERQRLQSSCMASIIVLLQTNIGVFSKFGFLMYNLSLMFVKVIKRIKPCFTQYNGRHQYLIAEIHCLVLLQSAAEIYELQV